MTYGVIDVDEVSARWNALGVTLPNQWALGGITFYGDMAVDPWVAFVVDAQSLMSGPEGFGSTPLEAIADLARTLDETSPDTPTEGDGDRDT